MIRSRSANVIGMRVRQEYDVHITEPGVRFVRREARVVEDSGTRRIFKQKCPVLCAKFA